MSGYGTATLDRPVATEASTPPPKAGQSPASIIAGIGVAIYAVGMLSAMVGTAVLQGDWLLVGIMATQCLAAVAFGGGAMAGALLAPDPYVKSH